MIIYVYVCYNLSINIYFIYLMIIKLKFIKEKIERSFYAERRYVSEFGIIFVGNMNESQNYINLNNQIICYFLV